MSRFLTAEWRKLAIANYVVDPLLLEPYLPYKTELDTFNNKCLVSLVGFRFVNTKIRGIGIPFHRHFEEVNLRFYVKYKHGSDWRRGVSFIKEVVPLRALSLVANTIYKEKYVTLPMKHRWDASSEMLEVEYSWKHKKKWNNFLIRANSSALEIEKDSEEEFITEHYWGYTPRGKKSSSHYQVEHPRWLGYKVKSHEIDVNFGKLYGDDFSFLNESKPDSVMLAEGSEIAVMPARRIR